VALNVSALTMLSQTVNLAFHLPGSAGHTGPQGSQGSQGPQGSQDGTDGLSTDEILIPFVGATAGDPAFATPLGDLGDADVVWEAYVRYDDYVTIRVGSLTDNPSVQINNVPWVIKVIKNGVGVGTAQVAGTPVNPVGLVTIDNNGIWWMSDCYGDAPWPTDLDTSVPGAQGSQGVQCPRTEEMEIRLNFAKLSFGTGSVIVTNLLPANDSPLYFTDAAGNAASAGSLRAALRLRQELEPRIFSLSSVTETDNNGVRYWAMPTGVDSSLKLQFDIPTLYLGSTPKIQLRLLLYGTAFGTLGDLTLDYHTLSRPSSVGTPVTPPAADTTVTLTTNYAISNDQYLEVVSPLITVAAGDTLICKLSRALGDGYAGVIGLVRAQGILQYA